MEPEAMRLLAKALCTFSFGPVAIGEGILIGKAFEAMGRNPEIAGDMFGKMIVGTALAESTAIYSLVCFFLL
jgi:F-type H+-transporting ATPase subunit c